MNIKGDNKKKGGIFNKRGFTLLTMVITLSIMSVIMLIGVPNLTSYTKKTDDVRIEANLKNLYTASEIVHKTTNKLDNSIIEKFSNIIPVQIGEPTLELYSVNIYNGKVVATYMNRDGDVFLFPKDSELTNSSYPDGLPTNGDNNENGVNPENGDSQNGDNNESGDSQNGDKEEEVEATAEKFFTFNSSNNTITGYSKDGPKDVIIPNYINGVPVLRIGTGAFENLGIESVILPELLTDIDAKAFSDNRLKKLDIPDAVVHIKNSAFSDNIIKTVEIGDSVERIYNKAFYNNYLEVVKIPDTILLISNKAFENNGPNRNSAGIDSSKPGTYVLRGSYWGQ